MLVSSTCRRRCYRQLALCGWMLALVSPSGSWACVLEAPAGAPSESAVLAELPQKLFDLIPRAVTRAVALNRMVINGLHIEVGEVIVSRSQALELLHRVGALATRHREWRRVELGEGRWVLSHWSGSIHEAISLRLGADELSCLLNYSRQDLQRSLKIEPHLPMSLPAGFSRLTSSQEQSDEGWMYVFTLSFAGNAALGAQRLRTALTAAEWRVEADDERQPAMQASRQTFVFFAARDKARLRAAVFPSGSQTRVVLQVGDRR